MRRRQHTLTRRDFLRTTTYTAMATVLGTSMFAEGRPKPEKHSRVVLVRHPNALDRGHHPNAEVIQLMLDDGVKALVDVDDITEAWRQLIKAHDRVGIKSNAWAYLPTPEEVENAILRRVVDAQIPENRIRIDDRGARTTLADSTALINVRPLRTHHWAGIGGCLKNYIMFVKLPFKYHPNACASLGKIWTLPIVKDKTRLNVLVVLRPLFHGRGAHHYNPQFVWDYRGLLLSTDPVAVDALGVRLLSAKRRDHFGEDTPFPKRTHHVAYADVKYGLGVSDLEQIDLIKVGWAEGALI